MTSQIPAQPEGGPRPKPKARPATAGRPGGPRPARPASAKSTVTPPPFEAPEAAESGADSAAPAVEEWPPREWRETTRAAGQKQALYVALAMLVMFGVLVMVNIWGAKNG